MENTILINEINKNDKLEKLINKYLDNKEQLEKIEKEQKELLKSISEFNYKTIGIANKNIKLTLTTRESKNKIDYKETLKDLNGDLDIKDFKKEKIVMTWNDDKILDYFKDNVVYEKEQEQTITARITDLKRDGE